MPAPGPGRDPYVIQDEPARQLVNLKRIPIAVITSEAPYHVPYDGSGVAFLKRPAALWITSGFRNSGFVETRTS